MTNLAIGIATYQRLDGKTKQLLSRALKSIAAQTYQNYKLFLIGDHYDDDYEFNEIAKIIPEDKIYKENLPYAAERSKYMLGSKQLWCSGGVNAYNRAIDVALSQNYEYMCHLDHDDYWTEDHLEKINQAILLTKNPALVYTCADYQSENPPYHKLVLPCVPIDGKIFKALPIPTNIVHSTVCMNHKMITLKYRDVYAETGVVLEGDIDMWTRLASYLSEKNMDSYLYAVKTCFKFNA